MSKKLLSNAFSFNMTSIENLMFIRAKVIEPSDIPADVESVIGHEDTAKVVSSVLSREVPAVRATVQLEPGDILYLAQYKGPRLPEGATKLPEGATLEFLEITLNQGCTKECGGGCSEGAYCGNVHWMMGL